MFLGLRQAGIGKGGGGGGGGVKNEEAKNRGNSPNRRHETFTV